MEARRSRSGLEAGGIPAVVLAAVAAGILLGDGLPPEDEWAKTPKPEVWHIALRPPVVESVSPHSEIVDAADPTVEEVPAASSPSPDIDAVPLRVVVRDGTTGECARGAEVALLDDAGARSPLIADERGESHLLAEGGMLKRGQWANLGVTVRDPDGLVSEGDGTHRFGTRIALFAEEVRVDVALWPEARVRLVVTEADGTPAVGATMRAVRCAGDFPKVRADSADANGAIVVRGIPRLRGEFFEVEAGLDLRCTVSERLPIPGTDEERVVPLVLPATAPETDLSSIGCGGSICRGFGGRTLRSSHETRAEVRVKVLRRNGEPAPGVSVEVDGEKAQTNSEGRAELVVRAGHHLVQASAPGFVTRPEFVQAVPGETAESTLLQSHGFLTLVTVLDDDGREVAGATLAAESLSMKDICIMDGDTQLVAVRTGRDGSACLTGLPPGELRVRARFGSRTASGTVRAGDAVTIRLPAVEPDAELNSGL